MDPISLAIGAVGLGMQIFGGLSGAANTKASSQAMTAVSLDEAHQEQAISDQKQQAMEIAGRRQQLEIMRTSQRARANAVQSATSQGAQFGSGLQGGLAQVQDQSTFNMEGVQQALMTGRNIAGLNSNISQDRYSMLNLQNTATQNNATDQGYSSLGGALLKSGPVIGQLSKGFGGAGIGNLFMGGGSPTGIG